MSNHAIPKESIALLGVALSIDLFFFSLRCVFSAEIDIPHAGLTLLLQILAALIPTLLPRLLPPQKRPHRVLPILTSVLLLAFTVPMARDSIYLGQQFHAGGLHQVGPGCVF